MELPKLTDKEQNFLCRYFSNGKNGSDAYRFAYAGSGNPRTVAKEASRLIKKLAPWLAYYEENQAEAIKNELNYTAKQAFDEFEELKNIALEGQGKYCDPNVGAAIKAVENKSRLAGLLKDVTRLEDAEGLSLFSAKAMEKAKNLEKELMGG